MRIIRPVTPHARLAATALTTFVWLGATGPSSAAELDPDGLKSAYLACERDAGAGLIGRETVETCSMIYEDLKRLEFGGSFDRLRQWYQVVDAIRPPPGSDEFTGW